MSGLSIKVIDKAFLYSGNLFVSLARLTNSLKKKKLCLCICSANSAVNIINIEKVPIIKMSLKY
jgi:hypothetical protein